MMFTRFACAAVLVAACAVVSQAAPTIQFVDNMDSTVTLQIVTDANGSLGAELAVEVQATGNLMLTGATVNTALFDDANPGDNPFIPGSPIGGDTTGLWTNFAAGQAFAAYGSGDLGIGAFDFLTFDYEGAGTLEAFGLVAQQGSLNSGLTASIDLIPEPTTAVLSLLGLVAAAGRRRG